MGCGLSRVISEDGEGVSTKSDAERAAEKGEKQIKKVKKEAKRRRSASGLLENLVHEEFDKGMELVMLSSGV